MKKLIFILMLVFYFNCFAQLTSSYNFINMYFKDEGGNIGLYSYNYGKKIHWYLLL